MSGTTDITTIIRGKVMEIGESTTCAGAFVRLDRGADKPDIHIDGLTNDEARDVANHFGDVVTLTVRGAA